MQVSLTFERETSNTLRYAEDVAEGAEPVIRNMYVAKDRFDSVPQRLLVTIERA